MFEELSSSLQLIIEQTKMHLKTLGIILAIPWGVFLFSSMHKEILYLGIFPRRLIGLPGILFSPFLHANFNHIFLNSIPLVVLSNFILIQGLDYFLWVTLAIIIGSGVLTWCFGKTGLHVGASSVITGYWALLISDIFQQGTLTAIILGLVSFYYFAGIFMGIFPGKKSVSWEGHLFGLLAGLAVSWGLAHFGQPT